MEKKKFKLGLLRLSLLHCHRAGHHRRPVLPGVVLPGHCHCIQHLQAAPAVFVIPLMIVAYVTMGIADLEQAVQASCCSSRWLWPTASPDRRLGILSVSANLFPSFMSEGALERTTAVQASYISISIPPHAGHPLRPWCWPSCWACACPPCAARPSARPFYNGMKDFSGIIDQVLHSVIIPLLPLYVCGTFIDMTKSGKTYAILGILWKVFLVVIIMHLVCIFLQFCVAGAVSQQEPPAS